MGLEHAEQRRIVMRLLLSAAWLAFAGTVLWRPHPGQFNPWMDAGLYNVPFALAAHACWQRARRRDAEAAGWRLLALGLALFVAGNAYGSLVVGDQDIYPSPADVLWLSFYVACYAAIVLFVKARSVRFEASTWLDGAVAGLGAAALVVAFALDPLQTDTRGSVAVVATNLAYPTADLLLISLLVVAGNATWFAGRSWWWLAAGLGVMCAGDIRYLLLDAAGSYAEGGLLDISWPLGAVLIGLAACTGDVVQAARLRPRRYLIPMTFATAAVGLLVHGQGRQLPLTAVVCAVAALAAAAVRMALTVAEVAALADSRLQARTDDLTGLANRRHMLEYLQACLNEADPGGHSSLTDGRVALLLVDLDRFKEINDSLGHDAGDQLIRAVGTRLAAHVPEPGLLARLGGDEFAIVLPAHDLSRAIRVAHAARTALNDPFPLDGILLSVEASIGVTGAPDLGTSTERLMTGADVAMYRAKRLGSGVETFDPARDDLSRDRIELLEALRTAVADGQLLLHYQPQLDLRTGAIRPRPLGSPRSRHPHSRGLPADRRTVPLAHHDH